jgi:hypothetical protein
MERRRYLFEMRAGGLCPAGGATLRHDDAHENRKTPLPVVQQDRTGPSARPIGPNLGRPRREIDRTVHGDPRD